MIDGFSHSEGRRNLAITGTLQKRLESLGFQIQSSDLLEYIIPPLISVSAGPFIMGTNIDCDLKAYKDETPLHEIVTDTYFIGTFPVTVAEYACAVAIGVVGEPKPFRGSNWTEQLNRPDHPVTSISWFDAMSYCLWLGDLTGRLWMLPTEPEWEKAARGTDSYIYPWGNNWDPNRTNTPDGGSVGTTAIDAYPEGQSPYGVWDMVGNVWEWTSSAYQPYPYLPHDGREDLASIADRVLRGGAWYCTPINARVACRGIGIAGLYLGGGFRLVLHNLQE